MNKNMTKFLLLVIILLFTLGVASATDNTTTHTKDTSVALEKTTPTVEKVMTKTETTKKETNKTINKKENKNNIKKEPQTIILNSNNFDEYVNYKLFNEKVSAGDTIDIQGKLDSPRFALNVNKPVNIISSTGDAYIDLNTTSTDTSGGYKNGIFQVTNRGSGTNITGITFHNTRVSIENTSNIHLDTINCIDEGKSIGKGVGSFSIRGGSENIIIGNSYFKTYDNGGHSNVVFAGAYNCLFENNTVEGIISDNPYALVGNLLYLTTYNAPGTNINITIRNNTIRSINVPAGLATCYGLCLEGKGHIIENNYIDTNYPVMAQYADSSYGMETNIDEITFNNNVIVRGNPQLVFPGTVANNTFGENATLNQVKAYNNTFNNVTINNKCLFENNEAKDVTITGNNNTLRNNKVYSNEDYAVTVSGENNTLTDNKFAGYLGRGENALYNSTEIVSINNSENISRVFYFDDDNLVKYFDIAGTQYTFKTNMFLSNDIFIFNRYNTTPITFMDTRGNSIKRDYNITIINCHDSCILPVAKLTVINCTLLDNLGGSVKEKINGLKTTSLTFINSIIGQTIYQPTESINSTYYYLNKNLICPENTHIFINVNDGFTNEGILDDSVTTSSNVLIYYLSKVSSLPGDLYVNKDLNISAIPTYGLIYYDIHFDAGSAGTTVTGITFKGKVYVNDNNIKFTNCTFNQGLELNNTVYTVLDGNTINGSVNINSSNNLIFTNNVVNSEEIPINIVNSRLLTIENNNITTTADNTIVFDESSTDSIIKNNALTSNSLVGDETVVGYDNDVEDNTPPYNTSIIIKSEELLFKDDTQTVNISVINLYNNTPVTKGYVEVYFDGILQCIKPLVDGQLSVNISANKSSIGNAPIKVWYYDGTKYANKVSSNNIYVTKSNVTINVDEFTAKLNEKTNTSITFLNQKGNPIQDTTITVTVATTTCTIKTTDGIATLDELVTKQWLDSGRMTITFPENDMYNRNITTINLNTSKGDITPTINFEQNNDKVTINIGLVDRLNNNITDGKITITTLDGTQLDSTRIRNGTYNATVTLPENYFDDLIVNYTGSYYYNDFTQELEIPYNRVNTITTLTLPEPAIIKAPLEIQATVTDTEGNKVTTGKVIFTIGDEIIAEVDVTEGTATTTKTFTEIETLTIKATYQKNRDYTTSNSEATITLQKPTSHTNTTTENVTLGETTTLNAAFYDENDEAITEGKVIFRLNGKTLRDNNGNILYAEIEDGQATLPNVNITPEWTKPDTTLQAIYVGDNNNEPITTTPTTITVTRPEATITLETPAPTTAGQTITLKATVTNGENNINTGRVAFKLNGKTLKNAEGKALYAEVNDGIATITYTIPEKTKAKEYTLTAVFTDTVYDRVEAESKLNVVKA